MTAPYYHELEVRALCSNIMARWQGLVGDFWWMLNNVLRAPNAKCNMVIGGDAKASPKVAMV
jgi:hypothetical protein